MNSLKIDDLKYIRKQIETQQLKTVAINEIEQILSIKQRINKRIRDIEDKQFDMMIKQQKGEI